MQSTWCDTSCWRPACASTGPPALRPAPALPAVSSHSFWPTIAPTRPPMPWSISSKIRVGVASAWASVLLSASISRAVSPPEATRAIGLSGSPGLALIRNSTWSTPERVKGHTAPVGQIGAVRPLDLLDRHAKAGARHLEIAQLGLHLARQAFARRLALLAELGAQLARSRAAVLPHAVRGRRS